MPDRDDWGSEHSVPAFEHSVYLENVVGRGVVWDRVVCPRLFAIRKECG